MKKYFLLLTCSLLLIGTACEKAKKSGKKVTVKRELPTASPVTTPATTPASNNAPTIAATGVKHYICPNNCAGSGGPAQGNCPVCSTAYVHNAAYHNQPAASQPTAPNPFGAGPALPAAGNGMNAAGVYHYICSNGCAGGSGVQGSCATCGSALAHNQAYHN